MLSWPVRVWRLPGRGPLRRLRNGSRRMTRLPLTADSDCPHCQGSGVVRVEVYVPVELLRVGDHVPRERKLCRCVGATQPVCDAYRSTTRQGLRGGFDGFANGDAVVASMLPGGNPVP